MSDREPVIELRGIHKYYGEGEARIHVLKGIDLAVLEGQYVAITGASGSGKSTLLNLLGCLDRPSSGQFLLDRVEVATLCDNELSEIRNERIGFVFQSFNLISALSVLDNIQVPLLYGKAAAKDGLPRCLELLEMVGLSHRLDHRPAQLSGGERQRVAIARALVNDPVMLLADEPTGNLDSKIGHEVLEIFDELHQQGRTIVMITHDPQVAERADRQVHMHDGVFEGAA